MVSSSVTCRSGICRETRRVAWGVAPSGVATLCGLPYLQRFGLDSLHWSPIDAPLWVYVVAEAPNKTYSVGDKASNSCVRLQQKQAAPRNASSPLINESG